MVKAGVYQFASQPEQEPDSKTTGRPAPASVTEKNIAAIVRVEREALTHRTAGEQFADAVTDIATKAWFWAVHAIGLVLWIGANTFGGWTIDPRPFNLLNTIITIEATFLMLLVLASQHRMARISERRAHLNLQVDLLTEHETTVTLRMLERLFEHFKLDPATAAPLSVELRTMTDLETLVGKLDDQLDETARKSGGPNA